MSSNLVKLVLAIVITAGLLGALWWREHTAAQGLQAELVAAKAQLSELERLRAELDRLAAENQRLRAETINSLELARLRAFGNDVRWLREEIVKLEEKLAAVEAAPQLGPVLSGQLARGRVVVAAGETILSAGWLTPDGRHGLAFITPTEYQLIDGSRGVVVNARLAAVSPKALKAAGLDWFFHGTSSDAFASGVPSIAANQVLHQLESEKGAEMFGGSTQFVSEGVGTEMSFSGKGGQVVFLSLSHQRIDDHSLGVRFSLRNGGAR